MKNINYLEYKHSYAHAIEPKLKALNYNANVLKKPVQYIKAIVKNTLSQSKDLVWTDKEQYFFDTIMNQDTAEQVYYYCKNSVNRAKDIIVTVDEDGELI